MKGSFAVFLSALLLAALLGCDESASRREEPVPGFSACFGGDTLSFSVGGADTLETKTDASGRFVPDFDLPEGWTVRFAADDDPEDPEVGDVVSSGDTLAVPDGDPLRLVFLDEWLRIRKILVVERAQDGKSSGKGSSAKGSSAGGSSSGTSSGSGDPHGDSSAAGSSSDSGSGNSEEGNSSAESSSQAASSGEEVSSSSSSSIAPSSSLSSSSSSSSSSLYAPQLPAFDGGVWASTGAATETKLDDTGITLIGDVYTGDANSVVSASTALVFTGNVTKEHHTAFGIVSSTTRRPVSGVLLTGSFNAANAQTVYEHAESASDYRGLFSFGAPFDGRPTAFVLDYDYVHVDGQSGLAYVMLLNGGTIVASGALVLSASASESGRRVDLVYGNAAWYDPSLLAPAGLAVGAGDEDVTSIVALFASSGAGAGSGAKPGAGLTVSNFSLVYE